VINDNVVSLRAGSNRQRIQNPVVLRIPPPPYHTQKKSVKMNICTPQVENHWFCLGVPTISSVDCPDVKQLLEATAEKF
jgi:hypothetical protein